MPQRLTQEQFVQRAMEVHGDKYDYSLTAYLQDKSPVIIICPIHGQFTQRPNNHIKSKQGCWECAQVVKSNKRKMGILEFIRRANIVHNNLYDYSKITEYPGKDVTVPINCVKHGIFTQTIGNHLHNKQGCPVCAVGNYSNQAIEWLTEIMEFANIHIQHAGNGGEYVIPGTRLKADGYCKETNTIYEFHGSKWHGDPKIYASTDKCHPFDVNVTAGELLSRTLDRENKIRQLGYNLVVCWESDLT